jgi:hypothetical protein
MKKSIRFSSLILLMGIIIMSASLQIASGQTTKQPAPIPDDIVKIFQVSCYACHGSNGKFLPMQKLNFSKWADYGASKEADKAAKICSLITKGSMPPKSFREANPEAVPSKEQIALICKWAESLKTETGK